MTISIMTGAEAMIWNAAIDEACKVIREHYAQPLRDWSQALDEVDALIVTLKVDVPAPVESAEMLSKSLKAVPLGDTR